MKRKTATLTVYPVWGTSTTLAGKMTYRHETVWRKDAGADRGTITAEAQRFARLEGFTHIKIYHEYHSHPPSGGKTWKL